MIELFILTSKDMVGDILNFSYCQQIPKRDQTMNVS